MSNPYLASEQITAIRDSGMLPPADESDNTTRLLGFMNRGQRLYLTRLMLSVRESYRVATVDSTISATQTTVRIPTRAVGAKLKGVSWVDSAGSVLPLWPVDSGGIFDTVVNGGPGSFYVQENSLVFLSAPGSGTLRFTYYRRLNKIVAATAVGLITAINTGTKVVTIDTTSPNVLPSNFLTTATFDFVQGAPHFDTLGSDLTISAVGATTMTFSATLPTDLVVGDFVALSGETPICQAPVELHDVLTQHALWMYLQSQKDAGGAAAAAKTLEMMRADALALLSPRIEDPPTPLLNFNAPGWSRTRRRWPR